MRVISLFILLLGLTACHAHHHDGGAVRVDGLGEARWGDSGHSHGHGGKGCPPGLAKQGRCW